MSLGIYGYEDEIRKMAERYGIDETAAFNLGQTESAGNPYAIGPKTKYGTAKGMYQLIDSTANEMNVTNPFDINQSISGGLGYFDKMSDKYGSPLLGDVAYNWGPGNLDDLIDREGTSDLGQLYHKLPKETQNHLFKVWHPSSDPKNDSWLKGPIPETPSFTSPSKYADVEIKSASMPDAPTYSPRRDRDLSRITEEITALEDSKRQALEQMGNQGEIDPNQALAIALTAVVPTLLGMGFGGGLRGAAAGAQAGVAGANVGLQGLTAEMNKRDATNKLVYEDAKQRLTTKEAEKRAINEGMADAEELGAQTKFNADAIADRIQNKQRAPLPESVIQDLAKKTGQSPELIRAYSQLEPYQMQTMMYAMGANTKLMGDGPLQQISAGKAGLRNLASLRPVLEEMSSDSSLTRAIQAGKVTDYYKNPASAGYRFYAQIPTLQKQVASIMESGKLTDQDVAFLTPFVTGSVIYDTPEVIRQRLDVLEKFLKEGMAGIIDTQGAAGRNVSGFEGSGDQNMTLGAPTMQGPNGKTLKLKEVRRSGN